MDSAKHEIIGAGTKFIVRHSCAICNSEFTKSAQKENDEKSITQLLEEKLSRCTFLFSKRKERQNIGKNKRKNQLAQNEAEKEILSLFGLSNTFRTL